MSRWLLGWLTEKIAIKPAHLTLGCVKSSRHSYVLIRQPRLPLLLTFINVKTFILNICIPSVSQRISLYVLNETLLTFGGVVCRLHVVIGN